MAGALGPQEDRGEEGEIRTHFEGGREGAALLIHPASLLRERERTREREREERGGSLRDSLIYTYRTHRLARGFDGR